MSIARMSCCPRDQKGLDLPGVTRDVIRVDRTRTVIDGVSHFLAFIIQLDQGFLKGIVQNALRGYFKTSCISDGFNPLDDICNLR